MPTLPSSIPTLLLKSGRERSVLQRHPWIFSGAVKVFPQVPEGSIVAVCNNHHQLLGYGFFSSQSQISCRMFEWSDKADLTFGTNYWVKKIQESFALRQKYVLRTGTNAYRLIHAEGDNLPGLIVDVYNQTAVVQVLIQGTAHVLPFLIEGIRQCGIPFIYLKSKSNTTWLEGVQVASGWWNNQKPAEIPVLIQENGLWFEVDVEQGQKTGFFLDQRDNRALLQLYCRQQRVLNTFSYTGGFSVYAAAAGAQEVVSVDISKEAVAQAHQNIRRNGYEAVHQGIVADCFDYLKEMQTEFNVIILDPPAFAKSAKSVANAARGYKEINLTALKRIAAPGILFTFSCSQNIDKKLFRQIIFAAAADAGRQVRILHQLTQPIDHPINLYHPEGEYLKGLVLYVE